MIIFNFYLLFLYIGYNLPCYSNYLILLLILEIKSIIFLKLLDNNINIYCILSYSLLSMLLGYSLTPIYNIYISNITSYFIYINFCLISLKYILNKLFN